jgi:hypothetical protein
MMLTLGIELDEKGKFDPKFELRSLNLYCGNYRFEPPAIGPNGKPIAANVKLTPEQAGKLLEVLAGVGFFERARSPLAPAKEPRGRFAVVDVSHSYTNPPTQLADDLPWDAALPRLLDALHAALGNDEAARLLDRFRRPVAAALR